MSTADHIYTNYTVTRGYSIFKPTKAVFFLANASMYQGNHGPKPTSPGPNGSVRSERRFGPGSNSY